MAGITFRTDVHLWTSLTWKRSLTDFATKWWRQCPSTTSCPSTTYWMSRGQMKTFCGRPWKNLAELCPTQWCMECNFMLLLNAWWEDTATRLPRLGLDCPFEPYPNDTRSHLTINDIYSIILLKISFTKWGALRPLQACHFVVRGCFFVFLCTSKLIRNHFCEISANSRHIHFVHSLVFYTIL